MSKERFNKLSHNTQNAIREIAAAYGFTTGAKLLNAYISHEAKSRGASPDVVFEWHRIFWDHGGNTMMFDDIDSFASGRKAA